MTDDLEARRAALACAHIDLGRLVENQRAAAGGHTHLTTACTCPACIGQNLAARCQRDAGIGKQVHLCSATHATCAHRARHINAACIGGQGSAVGSSGLGTPPPVRRAWLKAARTSSGNWSK